MFKLQRKNYRCSFLLSGKCLFYPGSLCIESFQVLSLNKWVKRLFPLGIKNLVRGGVMILHDEIELIIWLEVILDVPNKTYHVIIRDIQGFIQKHLDSP